MGSKLIAKDIEDLREALATLTRSELEAFAIDKSIRANESTALLTPEQVERYRANLATLILILSPKEIYELSHAMSIVAGQLEFDTDTIR